MADSQPISWPDLAIGLYDRLTGRQAEISYEFENLHVKIPSDTTEKAQHAEWILDGCIKIRTRDTSNDPNNLDRHLNGKLQGRSVTIRASGNSIKLELENLVTLWSLFKLRKVLRPLSNLSLSMGIDSEIFYRTFRIVRCCS